MWYYHTHFTLQHPLKPCNCGHLHCLLKHNSFREFTYLKNIPTDSDPLKPHFYIINCGLQGYTLFFLFMLKNIDCGYPLELPQWGSSNEYPQSMFWAEIWKNIKFFIWKLSVFGCEIFNIFEQACFHNDTTFHGLWFSSGQVSLQSTHKLWSFPLVKCQTDRNATVWNTKSPLLSLPPIHAYHNTSQTLLQTSSSVATRGHPDLLSS